MTLNATTAVGRDQSADLTRTLDAPRPSDGGANLLDRLVAEYHAARTPADQGAALRELDAASGGRLRTEALVAGATGQAAPAQGAAAPPAPRYDASSLYGASKAPQLDDVRQTNFGDCYFAATLGAVAMQSPSTIQNAISYDAKTQSFNVTLHDQNGAARTMIVTQAEIDFNIAQGGGSRRDDGVANAPIWPDVMEVAYAKLLDTNHADGLAEGYTDLGNGGWPKDGMEAVTGREGAEVRYDKSWLESRSNALDEVGTSIERALASGKPVTAWSVPERDNRSLWGRVTGAPIERDGLANNHVYTVTRMAKDADGNWQVTLRNPWSHNMVGEGRDSANAEITLPLDLLVRTGGLNSFRVGQ